MRRRRTSASSLDFYRSGSGGASFTKKRRASIMSRSSRGSGLSKDEDVDLSTLRGSSDTAGKALMAFLKIIADVSRSRDLLESPENERLARKIPGYFVRLQYGLHAGW